MPDTRVRDDRDQEIEELRRDNQRLRDQQRQGRSGDAGFRGGNDPVTATMVRELMEQADFLLASNRQHDPRRADLAGMIYREISRLPNLSREAKTKARHGYGIALLNQVGWPQDAAEVFEQLIAEHDDRGNDVVPYATALLVAAHLALRTNDTARPDSSGYRQARDRVDQAGRLLRENRQDHEVGWTQVIKGVFALGQGNIPEATQRIATGIRLMQQYPSTRPGLGAVSEQRTALQEGVGQTVFDYK